MVLFKAALVVGALQLALAYPSNSSTRMFNKRADPFFSGLIQPLFTEVQQAQLKRGFADACALASAALLFAFDDNSVYAKYFNTDVDTLNNVRQVFNGIVGGAPPPDGTCAKDLNHIAVANDFPNSKNENKLSCTQGDDMASTRDGENPDLIPTIVVCPPLFAHGNIGPTVIPDPAPPPVTCDTVKEGGLRTTWRMNTIGSTILHEYTHVALLVENALPQGAKDSLETSDDPTIPVDDELFFYGPIDIQGDLRRRVGGIKSQVIADAYTWFANEAFWSQHCGEDYGLSREGDDDDPKYGNSPGRDPDSNDS